MKTEPVNYANPLGISKREWTRLLGANQFNPDVYAFDTETDTFSDQFTLADVTSDTVTPIK